MKKSLVVKAVKTVIATSFLSLTACNSGGGGGGGGGAAAAIPGVQGGIYKYNNSTTESCDIKSNSYVCTQLYVNQNYSTQAISFSSLQDLCSKMQTDSLHTVNVNANVQLPVAQLTRQNYVRERCQNLGSGVPNSTNGTNPNYPQYPGQYPNTGGLPSSGGFGQATNLKSFSCDVSIRNPEQNVMVPAQFLISATSGSTVSLNPYFTTSRSFLYIFQRYYSQSTSRFAKLSLTYLGANKLSGSDQIKLTAEGIDDDLTTSVLGYAGAGVSMVVDAEDSGSTSISVSCKSIDAATVLNFKPTKYRCVGKELVKRQTHDIAYETQYDENLMDQSFEISDNISLNTSSAAGNAISGTAQFHYSPTERYSSTFDATTALNSASEISIQKYNYKLKLKCQPIR